MNPGGGISAYDVVNKYKERELDDIIGRFGEERFHSRIAGCIVEERTERPIETTYELAAIVYKAVGSRYRHSRIDPATRTFQALRIAVNDELGALEEGLKKAVTWLGGGGRIAVISFHSLEDRIVKNLFKGYAELGIVRIITKKPILPSREEMSRNPRSRSAKLRVAERI
jgi:16S rRNA (cytosine1402-N4)-methyltransferase